MDRHLNRQSAGPLASRLAHPLACPLVRRFALPSAVNLHACLLVHPSRSGLFFALWLVFWLAQVALWLVLWLALQLLSEKGTDQAKSLHSPYTDLKGLMEMHKGGQMGWLTVATIIFVY